MDQKPAIQVENADFGRGLCVCQNLGQEFSQIGSARLMTQFVGSQSFAVLLLVPVLVFFLLRDAMGLSAWLSGTITGLVAIVLTFIGIRILRRTSMGRTGKFDPKSGQLFTPETDSRYRVRAVIPQKRQTEGTVRWAQLAKDGKSSSLPLITPDELEMIRGGFDPIIIRPWFGVARDRKYLWTSIICGFLTIVGITYLLVLMTGGWLPMLRVSGFAGYGMIGSGMVGGVLASEFIWPVYIRLVPGQLDIFRYGFLGSGKPVVESFDLHTVGVCVDFGGYLVALEPARPIGEPLPTMVQSKKWPNGQVFPDWFKPTYFALTLLPNRRELAQRLIQASRTSEPTPPVSLERLGE